MSRIFISYSGSRFERAHLFYALRDHGLVPWRDVESLNAGDNTTETIEAELERCSTVILWINDEVLNSAYVTRVELPAVQRVWAQGQLRIVPVFDGMTPKAACKRLSSASGIEVGESNGYQVELGREHDATAARLGALVARAEINRAAKMGREPIIRVVSYRDTAALRDEAVVNLDWRHHLTDDVLTESSEQRLRSALTTVSSAFMESYGACEITLAIKAHLPVAVALGHAFSQVTGCTLRMPRDGDAWSTSLRVTPGNSRLDERPGPMGPVRAAAASVEVSISRDVAAGVNAYVASGRRFRHRLALVPALGLGREAAPDSDTANLWARQIGESLITLVDRPDVERTSLFLAVPVELAVMVGWWSNAGGKIDLMNWTGKSGPYERMWTLP